MSNNKTTETTAIIKQTISELLELIGIEAEIRVGLSEQNNIMANIQTNEAGFLIGQAGANLDALQYLVRLLVNKKLFSSNPEQPELVHFVVDVNNYKEHRSVLLREMAEHMAKQVLSRKSSLVLHPMSAYERRIIHLTLANYNELKTESIGEGQDRRVVIKLANSQ